MRVALPDKLKPAYGFSHFLHLGLVILLPLLVYILVRMDFVQLAIALVLLSKWRVLAVRPRYWLANIRTNAVDMMVGISIVIFMASAGAASIQLLWAAVYGFWLIYLKPGSTLLKVAAQALVAQFAALTALHLAWVDAPIIGLVVVTYLICYATARHFLSSFDEPHTPLYANTWGYFGAAVAWLLSHWLLFYGYIAQPALLLTVLGFGLGAMYYLEETDKLSVLLRRQFLFIMASIIVIVLVFSDWGDKTI